jgi:hypothetical protein
MSATARPRKARAVLGGPCITCGEATHLYEDDLTVEFAKEVLDFLYEDPKTPRRLAERDYRPQDNGKWIHLGCFTTYAATMEAALAARPRRSAR